MIPAVTSDAILNALSQFDTDYRQSADWANWETNKAHKYAIEHAGNRYPVKQIVSLAANVPVEQFSGGEGSGQANQYVRARGFTVATLRKRNPAWIRDELILALDLYLQHRQSPPAKSSSEIAALSDTLNQLGQVLGVKGDDDYRNANGVYMKLMNFRRLDPLFVEQGKGGLSHGGKLEEAVWHDFGSNPVHCQAVADQIRDAIIKGLANPTEGYGLATDNDDDFVGGEEGRLLTRIHRTRERNRKLVQLKKAQVSKQTGKLCCEVCGFNFKEKYGDHGDGFIECHHAKPVHEMKPGEKTQIADLHLLCANCHRMIHARKPWLALEELQKLVSSNFQKSF